MANEIAKTQGTLEVAFERYVDAYGKHKRKAVYQQYSSIVPETKQEKLNFLNLLNGDVAQQMNDHIGKQIAVSNVIFNPYNSLDEETGEEVNGVNSFLITEDGTAYVTSSKSVYNKMKDIITAFGEPAWLGEDMPIVKPVKKQGRNFKFTDLEIVM